MLFAKDPVDCEVINDVDRSLVNFYLVAKLHYHMLIIFPYDPIEQTASERGWIIHRIERTISASKESRRKQEEWMVCNYEPDRDAKTQTLF